MRTLAMALVAALSAPAIALATEMPPNPEPNTPWKGQVAVAELPASPAVTAPAAPEPEVYEAPAADEPKPARRPSAKQTKPKKQKPARTKAVRTPQ